MAFMAPMAEKMTQEDCAEFELEGGPGWYSRLSASGYLDCTEWDGPHANAFRALRAVCDTYECDVRGDDRKYLNA